MRIGIIISAALLFIALTFPVSAQVPASAPMATIPAQCENATGTAVPCQVIIAPAAAPAKPTPPVVAPVTPPAATPISNFSGFVGFGLNRSPTSLNLNIGVADNVTATEAVFLDVQSTPNSGNGAATQILLGIRQDFPSRTVRGYKVTPFALVGYGATVANFASAVKSSSAASISNPLSIVTTVATNANFTAEYGAGFRVSFASFDLSVGMTGTAVSGTNVKPAPLIVFSKSF